MDNNFSVIANNIKARRTIKPSTMNGNKIPNGHIASILELADWAPNHGNTEPWRFIVFEEPAQYCKQHAELYKVANPGESFNETVYNNLSNQANTASHVVIAYQKRGDLPKIPVFEEVIATSCAVQNLLLGATALNIGAFWSTGGMVLKPAFAEHFGLGAEDSVLGVLFLGYTDNQPEGKRKIPLEEKIIWNK
ncbi:MULTISPECIES: nitroreductase family protein [unclassified Mucilaginibacter]|uniref:nitroreductase family protein n=1 Tax=unclassified Mucilaginibacter TaxID=2617802 RepID=UPI00095FA62F|nr:MULTISPECIES: nitroreductase [unclassified Mucilaginibacter]OJW12793.1 MAG: nitroreductase [Mucilaginibacter sp. 44-25]PLW90670.1 MAG: nitroreductase [Mucilaginibacter sp.]PMP65432.1 MAG: nitroreductase [Mucilaginibacter sp.]